MIRYSFILQFVLFWLNVGMFIFGSHAWYSLVAAAFVLASGSYNLHCFVHGKFPSKG